MFPFQLEHFRIRDIDNEVELKTYALDFELYQIVCVDLQTGIERNVGGRIVGMENIEQRFNETIESLEGAYIFPKQDTKVEE